MGFTEAIKTCFSKLFTCKGRASRSEYWYFILFLTLMFIAIIAIISISIVSFNSNTRTSGNTTTGGMLSMLLMMALIFFIAAPFCVTIRRLHDIGKPGAYFLFNFIPYIGSFILLYFMCLPSDDNNQYGENTLKSQIGSRPAYTPFQSITPPSVPTNQVIPPSIPKASYFVVINNQQVGPLHLQDIKKMLQDGQINRQTLIWKQGMSDWDVIANLQDL